MNQQLYQSEKKFRNSIGNLQDTIEKVGNRDIVMGDFKAKMWLERTMDEEKLRGPYGKEQRNVRKEKLI